MPTLCPYLCLLFITNIMQNILLGNIRRLTKHRYVLIKLLIRIKIQFQNGIT